jgi:hypothetical protein
MDFSEMSLSEFLFHGRYHLMMAVFFVYIVVVVVQEVVRERRRAREERAGESAAGIILTDPIMGATMADGGETIGVDEEV